MQLALASFAVVPRHQTAPDDGRKVKGLLIFICIKVNLQVNIGVNTLENI